MDLADHLRAVALICGSDFDTDDAGFQFVERDWSGCRPFGISYHLGVDGISMFFVLLSTFC